MVGSQANGTYTLYTPTRCDDLSLPLSLKSHYSFFLGLFADYGVCICIYFSQPRLTPLFNCSLVSQDHLVRITLFNSEKCFDSLAHSNFYEVYIFHHAL